MSEQIVFPETPAEFDEALSKLDARLGVARSRVASASADLARALRVDVMPVDRLLEASAGVGAHVFRRERLAELAGEEADARSAVRRYDAEFRARGGWSRFFLAQSSNGHIHSSTRCQTCNRMGKATSFGWLTDLSGASEAEAVEKCGPLLCTVCFPSAPLEWTNGREVEAEKRKAARCEGSGLRVNRDLPHRMGYYSGNWVTCEKCDARPAPTASGKVRAHKPVKED